MQENNSTTKNYITTKNRDVFHTCNFILAVFMSLACVGMLIYYLALGNKNDRILACVVSVIPFMLPFVIEFVARRRFGNWIMLIYLLFVFYAAFVGSVVGLFKTSHIADKISHTLFGYLVCFLGLSCTKFGIDKKQHPWLVLLFCFFASMAFASLWELFEFSCDTLFGQTMQGYPVNGVTDLTDSMLDMLVNLVGASVFAAQYVIHTLSGKNLMIDTIIDDLKFKKR